MPSKKIFKRRAILFASLALLTLPLACGDETTNVAQCGNGKIETGEACEPSQALTQSCQDFDGTKTWQAGGKPSCGAVGSASACQLTLGSCIESQQTKAVCGNDEIETGEACEPSQALTQSCKDFDGTKTWQAGGKPSCGAVGSASACQLTLGSCVPKEDEKLCGNGSIDENENCDDGNQNDGDGCNRRCQKEGASFFSANPRPEVACGDGKHEAGEICDPIYEYQLRNNNQRHSCVNEGGRCYLKPIEGLNNCGTGTLEEGEECDDGNTARGDGCSEKCKKEPDNACQMKNGARVKVILVVDGDTLKADLINDGQCNVVEGLTLRLHGMDSPECLKKKVNSTIRPNYSSYVCDPAKKDSTELGQEPFAYDAKLALEAMLAANDNVLDIVCETMSASNELCVLDATNYRYLVYGKVLQDERVIDLSAELLRQGYGFAYTLFSSKMIGAYCKAEQEAIQQKKGVWTLAKTLAELVKSFGDGKKEFLSGSEGERHKAICKLTGIE